MDSLMLLLVLLLPLGAGVAIPFLNPRPAQHHPGHGGLRR